MKSLSSVGLGLSVVFGCLILALIAELYYLLWWKKRFTRREIESDYSNPVREFVYLFCLRSRRRRPSSSSLSHHNNKALNPQQLCSSSSVTNDDDPLVQEHQSNKDFFFKPFGDVVVDDDDDSMELELMRLHNLSGPPRFLFTIIEETKEDLESEDGKSRNRSLSDLLLTIETPYLTPLSSPSLFTPPLTPMKQQVNGFNPLLESSTDVEFSKMIRSSPPPKFKFLKDAEEKLYRRRLLEKEEEEAEKKFHKSASGFVQDNGIIIKAAPNSKFLKDEDDDEEEGSFITIIVDKNKEQQHHHQQQFHSSSSSQVLPLANSPSTFRSTTKKKKSHSIPH